MKVQLLKDQFKQMLRDERGITVSSDTIMWVLGTVIVTGIVTSVVTVLLTGENKDGTGGIAGTVTENVNKVMESIMENNN